MPGQTTNGNATIDAGLHHMGMMFAMFDPLRFRAWAELGLTTAQLRVLFHVRGKPGVTAGELATRLAVTPPTISGIVDRLVKLSLIRREEDESDRRLVRNHLTPQGEAACGRLEKGTEVFTRRILTEMDNDELEALAHGLHAFIKASGRVAKADPNLPFAALHEDAH